MVARIRLNKFAGSDIASRRGVKVTSRPAAASAFVSLDDKDKNGIELTTAQLLRMFNVTSMTLYNWRSKRGMPFYHLEGGAKPPVRYDEGMILAWARQNGIAVKNFDYKHRS